MVDPDVVVSPCPRCGKDNWEKVDSYESKRVSGGSHETIRRRCRECGKTVYEQGARVR